jgi:3',5'-cyclic AMP phosphodiesterase CpdA
MKLNILSDLHLGQGDLAVPANEADIVVLAGDIARPAEAVAWASRLGKPALYVAGNHEFYGGSLAGTKAQLKALCAGTNIRVLDDEVVYLGNVRFLGSTLWTDFLLFGEGNGREAAMAEGSRFMRDFSRIRISEDMQTLLRPQDTAELFRRHSSWLCGELAKPHAVHGQHPSALRGLDAQCVLRVERAAPAGRRTRAALDPRPHPRQLRLHGERHARRVQPARLRP